MGVARKPPCGARPMMVTARWSGGYSTYVLPVNSLSEGTGDGQKVSGDFREFNWSSRQPRIKSQSLAS